MTSAVAARVDRAVASRSQSWQAPDGRLTAESTSDRTRRWFWLFVAVHAVVWTLLPTFSLANPPLDVIEMLQWGHQWQWGYHRHPPLPAWVAETAALLSGRAPWAIYLASQAATAVCLLAVWKVARRLLSPWPALTAVVLLEGCYFFSYTTPELNNNVIARPFWALAVWFLFEALYSDRWRWWIATGVSLGLAMLCKYDAALLVASLLMFAVVQPDARRKWRKPGPYLCAAVALLLFAPHAWWAAANDFVTLKHVQSRSAGEGHWLDHLRYPLSFAGGQFLAVVGPILLLAVPLIGWRARRREMDRPQRFDRALLLTVVFGPIAWMLLLSFLFGLRLRSMWASPFWTFLPVLILFSFRIDASRAACRRAIAGSLLVAVLIGGYYYGQHRWGPYFGSHGLRSQFPGQQLAKAISNQWHARFDRPLPLVGGSYWTAGNVAFFLPERPSVYAELSPVASPWTNDEDFHRRGGAIVWQLAPRGPDDANVAGMVRERFPSAEWIEPIVIDWQTGADLTPIQFAVALVPPQSP